MNLRRLSLSSVLLMIAISAGYPADAGRISHNHHRNFNVHRNAKVSVFSLCKRTDYPSLCFLAARFGKIRNGDVTSSLTQSLIQATISKTIEARNTAASLSRRQTGISRAILKVCEEVYGDAINDLNMSLKSLASGSLADLNINLSAAIADISTCDDSYAETPGMKSPLANLNSDLSKFASNSLAVASEIRKH